MALASIQHYTCGSWSNCAPRWLCFAAICDAEAADSQETTLKHSNWRNVLQVSRAFERATAVMLKRTSGGANAWRTSISTRGNGELVHLASSASQHPALWKLLVRERQL